MPLRWSLLSLLIGLAEFNAVILLVSSTFLYVAASIYYALSDGNSILRFLFTQIGTSAYIICSLFLIKRAAGGRCFSDSSAVNLRNKVVLVTGGASGIGLETVRAFASRGATVILAARGDPLRLEHALETARRGLDADAADRINVMNLDLASFASIHTFVQDFIGQYTRLNILILNAGAYCPPYSLTEDGFEFMMQSNHLGHFLLVNLLLDTLISSQARIVHVSAIAQGILSDFIWTPQPDVDSYESSPHDQYALSKLAQVYTCRAMEKRYGANGLHSFALHPGVVNTQIAKHFPRFVRHLASPFMWLLTKTPSQGIQTTLFAALSSKALPGCFHAECRVWPLSQLAKDDDKAEELFEQSMRATMLK